MPTKEELLNSIQDRHYSSSEVKHLITSVSNKSSDTSEKIKKVLKGDVFIYDGLKKHRPFVVVKVLKGISLCLSMSTTKNFMNLESHKCRQFGDGYFNLNIIIQDNKYIKERFVGVMSDRNQLNNACKLLKFAINKI